MEVFLVINWNCNIKILMNEEIDDINNKINGVIIGKRDNDG